MTGMQAAWSERILLPHVLFSLIFKPKIQNILWSIMERDDFFESNDKKRYKRVYKKGFARHARKIIRLD